jgi:1-deoxy-D-xylulose-5-phosphate synthase
VASPKDEQELRALLHTAFGQDHPFALHYPRDPGFDLPPTEPAAIPVGRGELVRPGEDLLIVGFGPIVMRGVEAADALAAEGWSAAVLNARFAAPLDADLIVRHAAGKQLVVTLEESTAAGGFGSAVLEALADAGLTDPVLRAIPVRVIGVPAGRFVDHGSVADLRRMLRLDAAGITAQIRESLAAAGATPMNAPPAARTA